MHSFLHRPQGVLLRRALFQVHLWVGVLAGLYIFVVSITGAALMFRIDMQRGAYPHLFTPSAAGPLADPAAVLESLQRAYPDYGISGIDAPTTARPTYLAYVTKNAQFVTVLMDPVSAQVLGELPDQSIIRTLQDLHFDLLAGRTGRVVNGVGAGCLLAMCVTGLVIWWPGLTKWRRAFLVDTRHGWKRVNWDLHSAVGIWMLAPLAMWAVTGLAFSFPAPFRAIVNWASPLTVARAPQSDTHGKPMGERPSWRALIEEARRHVPDEFVARVVVPGNDRGAFLVSFSPVSPTLLGADLKAVYLDQLTGARLAEPPRSRRTLGDTFMAWMTPLHVGNFGGTGITFLWFLLALGPPVLFISGLFMWWTRVVRPRWSA